MCGIAGFSDPGLDASAAAERLQPMLAAIRHRGPDDEGALVEPGIALGMRRLSIIDLATGRQPIHNEDRTIWVVFNGEIYNYTALRAELEGRGHRFYTSSDTETIVHAYEEWGDDAFARLRGMFGIALWDARSRTLVLARDRAGIKPLHYAVVGDGCSSDPKSSRYSRAARSRHVSIPPRSITISRSSTRRASPRSLRESRSSRPDICCAGRTDACRSGATGRCRPRSGSQKPMSCRRSAPCFETPSDRT